MWILVDNSVECRGNCGKITLRSLWKTHEIVDNVILISCLLNLKSALESNLALFLTFLLFDLLTISIYIVLNTCLHCYFINSSFDFFLINLNLLFLCSLLLSNASLPILLYNDLSYLTCTKVLVKRIGSCFLKTLVKHYLNLSLITLKPL